MPLRVNVHAAIRVQGKLAVHRRRQRGREFPTLPGGRVKDREAVLDGLRREVREEIQREIEIGELLLAGEVIAASRQDIVLVFTARLRSGEPSAGLELIDPAGLEAADVMPPVLGDLVRRENDRSGELWLGNLYVAQPG